MNLLTTTPPGLHETRLRSRRPGSAEIHQSGEQITEAQPGSLNCVECGFGFSIAALDALPQCPNCGGSRFRRLSIFSQPTLNLDAVEASEVEPDWLPDVRAGLESAGWYLAFADLEGAPVVIQLEQGWTRIGRSSIADLRINDATVSRRHALVVLTDDDEVRALDDRSLNGLFVNGERVDWARLIDGDELEIGRYRLHVIEV